MSVPKLGVSFSRFTDTNLKTKAKSIQKSLTNNGYFPEPAPTLTELDTAINNFSNALADALDGSKTMIAQKRKSRTELEARLRHLAAWVTLNAKDDRTALVSSGFTLIREEISSRILQSPQNVQAYSGLNPGEIVLSIKAVKGAKAYSHEYALFPVTPSTAWEQQLLSVRSALITGLEAGKKYCFRVAAIGAKGQKAYSNEIAAFVQ